MAAALPPEPDTVEALEGEASHWVAEQLFADFADDAWMRFVGEDAPNGVTVTGEIARGAWRYVDYVLSLKLDRYTVEQRLDLPTLHPLCFGTCDLNGWAGSSLHVVEYKFGFDPVEVRECLQLLGYAEGILSKLPAPGDADQRLRVVLHVVQPRASHPDGQFRRWEIPATDVRLYANRIRDALAEATQPNPRTVAGDWCRNCPALLHCGTARAAAVTMSGLAGRSSPVAPSPELLSFEKTLLDEAVRALKSRQTAVDAAVRATIESGEKVPGWALESKVGNLKWKQGDAETLAAGKQAGFDLSVPMTPAQARDRLGMPGEVLNTLASRPTGGATLVPSSSTLSSKAFKK